MLPCCSTPWSRSEPRSVGREGADRPTQIFPTKLTGSDSRVGCSPGLIVSVVSSPTFYKSFRCRRFVVDVSSDSGVAHASIRARYEQGAATPCIPCQRGLSTVEFHERRLVEARTARPPTRGLAALPWLAVSVRLAKRRCLAFAPPPSSPGCDGPKREDKSETEETVLARAVLTPCSEPLSLFHSTVY